MPFGYLKDPLFLVCFAVYWLNRFLEDCGISPPIVRSYLNDLICLPFWCPIMLWANRRLGLRGHDNPPLAYEIVIPLLIWAIVFEVVLPASKGWQDLTFADPNDVLCYALGGAFAAMFWASWYRDKGRVQSTSRIGSLLDSGPKYLPAGTGRHTTPAPDGVLPCPRRRQAERKEESER